MIATFITSVSLPNDANALFGALDEATRIEQFAQIALAEKDLEAMLQSIEHIAIGAQLANVFEQMRDIARVIEVIMEYDVPEEYTEIHTTMTPENYDNLRNEAEAYMEEIDGEIKELEWHIALSDGQMSVLSQAAMIAEAPPSDITVGQAQFLGDAARLEQQRRETALRILRDKREAIRNELAMSMGKARQAAAKCIRTGVCE